MAKTTLKVDKKHWDYLQREFEIMFLRRDSYLNHVLPQEIDLLAEMPPNDEEGYQWLKKTWIGKYGLLQQEEVVQVAINLDSAVIDKLNQTCESRLVPRDAFFNCFLQFVTRRLFQAAVVIKDLRTNKDVASKIIEVLADDEIDDGDKSGDIFNIACSTFNERDMEVNDRGFYNSRLHYTRERVESDKLMIESLLDAGEKAPWLEEQS